MIRPPSATPLGIGRDPVETRVARDALVQAGVPGLRKVQRATARSTDKKKVETANIKPLDIRQAPRCKRRPTETKGKGASRPFVPWCDRKG